MQPKLLYIHHCLPSPVFTSYPKSFVQIPTLTKIQKQIVSTRSKSTRWKPSRVVATPRFMAVSASLQPLDLTEGNVKLVLSDARAELAQLFDASVGMTGVVELVELDGPFVKISLRGRFWHKRSTVLERIANYLKQRIPEILEVDIEDEKQLDDSPENF